MKRVCSWCKKVLPDVEPFDDDRITHTICAECKKEMLEEPSELLDCSDILYPDLPLG